MVAREEKYIANNVALMSEWNWKKNDEAGFDPNKITYGSARKVWWKCPEGHEWEDSPNHRSQGRNCPECAKIIRGKTHSKNWIEGKGSLEDNNPALAAQWHPTKNGGLTPKDVTVNNGRKAWWICEKRHEWEAVIKSRNVGSNCPVCSGHKILVGYNDLATVNPELAAQWHPDKNGELMPMNVTVNNGRKVWWKCPEGHEWEAKISNRTHGCNCPICSGKQVLTGYNDLSTANPGLAAQWHPEKNGDLKPEDVTLNSNKGVWWICSKGHEWKTSVAHRSRGHRCPDCYGESKTSFPEQAIYFYLQQVTTACNRYKVDPRTEIDVFLPDLRIGIEYDGAYYHSGEKSANREKRKQEELEKQRILLLRVKEIAENIENDLQTGIIYVKIGPSDDELKIAIEQLLLCIDYIAPLSGCVDVDIARDRSLIYEQYIASEKANSLLEQRPEVAMQWHPTKNGNLKPEHVSVSSNKKVWWLCAQGHEWAAVINSRSKGIGCPYCSKRRRYREENA